MQLTSKGQVTIPKKYRDKYGLREGSEVAFVEDRQGLRLVKGGGGAHALDGVRGILHATLKKGRSVDALIEKLRGR